MISPLPSGEGLDLAGRSKPTRGLEPRTPSLRGSGEEGQRLSGHAAKRVHARSERAVSSWRRWSVHHRMSGHGAPAIGPPRRRARREGWRCFVSIFARRSYEARTIPKRAAHAGDTLGRWTFRLRPARSRQALASAKGLEPDVADFSASCSVGSRQNRFLSGYGTSASAAAGRSRPRGSGSARSTARAVPRCGRGARSRPRRLSPGAQGEPPHPEGLLAVNEASDLDGV